jgi:hypothetical protein
VIEVGESFQLEATTTNAQGIDVLWFSHHTNVVTVDDDGTVTGVSPGFGTIEAGLDVEDEDIFDQKTLEVTAQLRSNRISGTFAQTASRTGTTGQCPAPIGFSDAAQVVPTGTGSELTAPLAIGDGIANGVYDPADGSWLATGQATLTNGFTVVTTYDGAWVRDPATRRIRFTGTVTVEHVHPTLGLVCTETYDVTLEGEGTGPVVTG